MRFDDGKTQAWVVLSLCAALTLTLVVVIGILVTRHAGDWAKVITNDDMHAPAPLASPDVPLPPDSAVPTPLNPGSWVGADDYPPSALRAAEEGVVKAALDVDQAGRPVRCMIVESSGVAALDRATYAAFMRSGRFNHGLAQDGPAHVRHWPGVRVRWTLPLFETPEVANTG